MVIKTLLIILFMLPSIAMSVVELDSNDDGKIDLSFIKSGVAVGDVVVYEDVGTCSDPQYTTEGTCVGTWTAAAGLPIAEVIDATGFTGNLAATDDTLQEVAQKVNDLATGGASALNDLTDVDTTGAISGSVIKHNGSSWVIGTDNTAAGAGYLATAPTYSDEACIAGQYALSTTTGYVCVSSGDWNTFSLTDWNNPTPVTYSLTMAITDATGTGSTFTVNADSATVLDTPKTWAGLTSATEAVTFTPNTTETSACTGTGVTGSDPNWLVDMSAADVTDMACTVSAAGAALIVDNFDRADENPLTTPWVTAPGKSDIILLSNEVTSTVSDAMAYHTTALGSDQYAQVTSGPLAKDAGPAVRVSGTSGNLSGYFMGINSTTGGRILKYNSGAVTVPLTFALNTTLADGDIFKISAVGTTISVYQNGAIIDSTTDTSVASGSAAIRFGNTNGSLDDFEADTL